MFAFLDPPEIDPDHRRGARRCSAVRSCPSWPRTSARRSRSSRTVSPRGRRTPRTPADPRSRSQAPLIPRSASDATRRRRLTRRAESRGQDSTTSDMRRRLRIRRRSRSLQPPHTPCSMRCSSAYSRHWSATGAVGADLASTVDADAVARKEHRRWIVAAVAVSHPGGGGVRIVGVALGRVVSCRLHGVSCSLSPPTVPCRRCLVRVGARDEARLPRIGTRWRELKRDTRVVR